MTNPLNDASLWNPANLFDGSQWSFYTETSLAYVGAFPTEAFSFDAMQYARGQETLTVTVDGQASEVTLEPNITRTIEVPAASTSMSFSCTQHDGSHTYLSFTPPPPPPMLIVAFTPQVLAASDNGSADEGGGGAGGGAPGCVWRPGAVTYVERALLDAIDPGWMRRTGPAPIHYTYDERDPRTFYITPIPSNGGGLDIVYTVAPEPIPVAAATDETSTIGVADTYFNQLIDFVMFRALSKSTEAGDQALAARYASRFYQVLGVDLRAERNSAPDKHTYRAERQEQLR